MLSMIIRYKSEQVILALVCLLCKYLIFAALFAEISILIQLGAKSMTLVIAQKCHFEET